MAGKGYIVGKLKSLGLDVAQGWLNIWNPDTHPLYVGGQPSLTVRSVVKEITTTQVLALNATPITVVAAPGAGKALVCMGAHAFIDYATTAYADDDDDDMVLQYTGGAPCTTELDGADFLDNAADIIGWMAPVGGVILANTAIEVTILNGEIVTGDSPIFIRTYYAVVDSTIS